MVVITSLQAVVIQQLFTDLSRRLLRPLLPNLAIKKSVMDDPTVLVTLLEIVGNSGVSALLIDVTNPSHVQLSAFADACLFAPSVGRQGYALDNPLRISRRFFRSWEDCSAPG